MKFAIVFLSLVAITYGSKIPHWGFPEENTHHSRVVNGVEAGIGEAPYIVSLRMGGSHFCGGVLISSNEILTAAHCLAYTNFMVGAGMHDRNKPAQELGILKAVAHPKYGGGVGPYDIAKVHLDGHFELSDTLNVIDLPTYLPEDDAEFGTGILFGWGRDENGALPNNLRKLETDLLSASACKAKLPFSAPIATSNICSSSMNQHKSACNGDSGGPLVKKLDNGKTIIVGLVSWGYVPCGDANYPSVYTCVAQYLDWISAN